MRRLRHLLLRRPQHGTLLGNLLLAHHRLDLLPNPLQHVLLRSRRRHAHGGYLGGSQAQFTYMRGDQI